MDSDGSNVHRLTYGLSYCDSPAWSPNGDKIAFVSRESGGFQIYTVDITGENVTRLTDQGNNENPSWSPDGYHLTFASSRTGKFEIYTMSWDGSNQTKITSGGGNFSPAWSPRF
jgi:TolB protein